MVDLFQTEKIFHVLFRLQTVLEIVSMIVARFFLVFRAGGKSFINNRNHRKKFGLIPKTKTEKVRESEERHEIVSAVVKLL